MSMIRKKKKNNIIVLVFIIILLIILLVNLSKNEIYYKKQLEYIISDDWNDEVYPKGMPILVSIYDGEQSAKNIGKSLYYVVTEVFPNYYNDLKGLNDNEIKKYYKKNKDKIMLTVGDVSEKEFVSLIDEIVLLNHEPKKFTSFYIDTDSIVIKDGYITANLFINYENEEISVKIRISNYLKDDISSVKYYK